MLGASKVLTLLPFEISWLPGEHGLAMRRRGLHQHTIEGIRAGRAVRRSTLKRILKVMR
jgi:hypothetical protein